MSHPNPTTGGTGRDRISILNLSSNGAMPSRGSENSGRWLPSLSMLEFMCLTWNTVSTGHPSTFISYSGQLGDRYIDSQMLAQCKLTLSPSRRFSPRPPGRTSWKSCSSL